MTINDEPPHAVARTYHERRGNALWRLDRLRRLEAPLEILRMEQLLLWALRQSIITGLPYSNLPEWDRNYRRFVLIHRGEVNQKEAGHV